MSQQSDFENLDTVQDEHVIRSAPVSEISVRTYNKIGAVASYLPTKFEAVSRKPAGSMHTISQKQS